MMSTFEHSAPKPGILAISGEMTVANASELRSVLLEALALHDKLEVDLLNVSRFDTAGVQLLVVLQREARAQSKQLSWLGYSLAVEEVLELLDLSELLGSPRAVVWS
jgi:anti-sigma B factor antagonist